MNEEDKDIPIAVRTSDVSAFGLTIEVLCQRTEATLEAWQMETFNAIVAAYNSLKSAYDAQVAVADINQGVVISGRNPDINRQIEEELKKSCLVLLTD